MKKLTYLDRLLNKGTDKAKQEELSLAAQEAKLHLEADILATQRELTRAKAELEKAKCAQPFVANNCIVLMDRQESLEKGLSKLESLKSELF